MQATRALLQHRQPMIRFLGKRTAPQASAAQQQQQPQPHPASPSHFLPDSFASYRQKAQQHGPLRGQQPNNAPPASSSISYGGAGRSGHSLGSVEPLQGQFFDRSELPMRFQRTAWTMEEMEAIESGGASMRV